MQYAVAFAALYIAVFFTLVYLKNLSKIPHEKHIESDWEPNVTVLIPAYNEEAGISKCIGSVLSLDYPKEKLEIIVLDDGSVDNTAEIANSFGPRGVQVISKSNSGKADS
ncbi:glycosyltransferase, partial [Candidatus Micrarchaeota archaeon]|nr:glycosyltransferase [Candidatus Micrarchaeota archaeon]